MAERPTATVVRAAQTMAVDQVTAEVVRALQHRGIPPILLKGPAIARWLYPEGGRSYGDTDLLVPPGDFGRSEAVLGQLGFARDHRLCSSQIAHSYYRAAPNGGPRLWVDLHRSLRFVQATPSRVWAVLSEDTATMTVAGATAPVLAIPARTAHIALHAAQHGEAVCKPIDDLRRAITAVGLTQWRQAAEVARRIGAEDCLSAGLRLLPEGRRLADELRLDGDIRLAVRLAASSNSGAHTLHQLTGTVPARERVSIVYDALFPSAPAMRNRSALASRGAVGLLLAYLCSPLQLTRHVGPALKTWKRSRRAS